MNTADIELVIDHEQYIFLFSESWSDRFAEHFVSKIWSMLDNECY